MKKSPFNFRRLLSISFLLFAASFVNALDGEKISAKDFSPHEKISEKFNETWSYQFVLDNGTKAFVNIATLQIPTQGRKIGCDLSFWNFLGKSYSVGRQYPEERLVYQKEKNRITIKDEYFLENLPGKGHRVFFSAHKNGDFLLDLTFETAVEGRKISPEIMNVGKEKFALFIHIPYGRVQGKIAYGKDTLKVRGYGTMDHSFQTLQATDMANRIITFSRNSKEKFLFGKVGIDKSGKPFGYAVESPSKILTPKEVKSRGEIYSGKNFPEKDISIIWNDDSSVFFSIEKIQQKFSLLNNFDGWLAKKAAKVLMGGEPFFLRGRASEESGTKIDWSIMGL